MKPAATCDLEFTGTVIEKATARTKVLDNDGHTIPVLCMVVELESATRQHCQLEQPFPVGHMAQCEAAARRYKRGARVTFSAPAVGMRLHVPNVAHLHVHNAEEAQAA